MAEDKSIKISKELTLEKANILKGFCSRDGKNLIVWQIVKISEFKATFVAFKSPLFNHLETDGKVSIQNYEQLGESMTLKVDKAVVDKIIDYYGDIVACICHTDGVVKTILTFEEIALESVDTKRLAEFLESMKSNEGE